MPTPPVARLWRKSDGSIVQSKRSEAKSKRSWGLSQVLGAPAAPQDAQLPLRSCSDHFPLLLGFKHILPALCSGVKTWSFKKTSRIWSSTLAEVRKDLKGSSWPQASTGCTKVSKPSICISNAKCWKNTIDFHAISIEITYFRQVFIKPKVDTKAFSAIIEPKDSLVARNSLRPNSFFQRKTIVGLTILFLGGGRKSNL